ncbi:MAG: TPR repeat protein [Alphaproteobacteria bacterium]|jgi:TPR repeat protein
MGGLGVKQDYTQAYLWLNVALEFNHNKWREVRDQMRSALTKEQVVALTPLVDEYIEEYGAKTLDVSCSRSAPLGSLRKVMQCRKYLTKSIS